MPTENTSLKNITPAGDCNSKSEEMDTGKTNTYQRTVLIVAGSLLALLVLVAVAGHSGGDGDGGHYLKSSAAEITKGGAGALAEYQVDTTNSALTNDIFGLGAVSENDEGNGCCYGAPGCCVGCALCCCTSCCTSF